tara:strand:- start:2489 stop:2752 length:264 start_codon:yes stop_codon:yes gene_type:complete
MLYRKAFKFPDGTPEESVFVAAVREALGRPVKHEELAGALSTPQGELVEYEILEGLVYVYLASSTLKGLRAVVCDVLESMGGIPDQT